MPPLTPDEAGNGLKEHFKATMLLVEPELNQWLRESYHLLNKENTTPLLWSPSSKPQLKWGRGEAEYVASVYMAAGWITSVEIDRIDIFIKFSGIRPKSHSQYGDH